MDGGAGESPEPPNPRDPGDKLRNVPRRSRVGPYDVRRVLGAGGMGLVYAARAPSGEMVAVKVLNSRDPEFVRRFRREAKIRIDAPNVVEVKAAGEDEQGLPYIVFELLDGASVSELLKQGPRPPREAVDIATQALIGLAAAHAAGVIHRDVKPANLFKTAGGTVKLLDFGIAMVAQATTKITKSGGLIGTPAYLSPEQAIGDSDVDESTDLWSVGAVLYELLSGRTPFERATAVATLLAIVREELVPLREVAPDVPADLAAVVERALRKDRAERWRSARDFIAALSAVEATPRAASRAVAPAIAADERRVVAVMLAEDVGDLELVRAAVEVRGGVFVPLVGRRGLGLFGGERWEGDEVKRAGAAGLEVRPMAKSVAVVSGHAMRQGGGISGEALSIAEEACARELEGVAIDVASARTFEGVFRVERLDDRICQLFRDRDPSTVLAFAVTPLLGREAEVAQMRASLERALNEGSAAVLLVSGPPGIGKTRLLYEMERLAKERGARVLVARGEPVQQSVAFSLISSAIGSVVDPDLSDRVKQRVLRSLVADALEGEERAVDENTAFLSELLGVEAATILPVEAARRDPRLMQDRLRMALFDVLAGLGRRAPLVLLADDLQWGDAESLALIEELTDELQGSMLVFGTARSEFLEQQPFMAGRSISLQPRGLITSDVAKLAHALSGKRPAAKLIEAIAARTGGNPLFVEQILLAVEEEGSGAPDELPLPLTVEAAIQSRLDHLPAGEKNLLKRASVFRRPFSFDEIEHLLSGDAKPMLASLTRRGLLMGRTRKERVRRYRFASALVEDVAYRMLGDELKRALHRQVAEYLSRREESDAEDLARHWELGGEPKRAADSFARATTSAARRGDSQSVLRCSDRASALGASRDLLFTLNMARSEALFFLGRRADQRRALETALSFATTEAERATARAELGWCLVYARESERALALLDEAIAEAEHSGDSDVMVRAYGRTAMALIYAGRLDEAAARLEAASSVERTSPWSEALLAGWRGQLASARGDPGARSQAFSEAIDRYEAVGDVRRAAGARTNLADAWNRIGAYGEAETALEAALVDCRRVGHRLMEGYALLNLGYALMMQNKTLRAMAALEDCASVAKHNEDKRLELWCRIYQARVELAGAHPNASAESLEIIANEAHAASLPSVRVAALWVASRFLGKAGDLEGAVELSSRAMSLLGGMGGVEEDEADVFVAAADALEAAGRKLDAKAVRLKGRERVEAIARRIEDDAFRRRFLRDVPAHRALAVDEDVTAL